MMLEKVDNQHEGYSTHIIKEDSFAIITNRNCEDDVNWDQLAHFHASCKDFGWGNAIIKGSLEINSFICCIIYQFNFLESSVNFIATMGKSKSCADDEYLDQLTHYHAFCMDSSFILEVNHHIYFITLLPNVFINRLEEAVHSFNFHANHIKVVVYYKNHLSIDSVTLNKTMSD